MEHGPHFAFIIISGTATLGFVGLDVRLYTTFTQIIFLRFVVILMSYFFFTQFNSIAFIILCSFATLIPPVTIIKFFRTSSICPIFIIVFKFNLKCSTFRETRFFRFYIKLIFVI